MAPKKIYEYRLTRTKCSIAMDETLESKINHPEHIKSIMHKLVPDVAREHMYAFFMDVGNRIIGYELLGVGSISEVTISPTDLLRSALVCGANAVILSHNHPSGSSIPSVADNELTAGIKRALQIIGLSLTDHVIIGDKEKYFSYAQAKVIIN